MGSMRDLGNCIVSRALLTLFFAWNINETFKELEENPSVVIHCRTHLTENDVLYSFTTSLYAIQYFIIGSAWDLLAVISIQSFLSASPSYFVSDCAHVPYVALLWLVSITLIRSYCIIIMYFLWFMAHHKHLLWKLYLVWRLHFYERRIKQLLQLNALRTVYTHWGRQKEHTMMQPVTRHLQQCSCHLSNQGSCLSKYLGVKIEQALSFDTLAETILYWHSLVSRDQAILLCKCAEVITTVGHWLKLNN